MPPTVQATYRNTFGDVAFGLAFRFHAGRDATLPVFVEPEPTDIAGTVTVAVEAHPFALVAGALADHPLRDDWLREMGFSPDIDLDVL
jgi:hypothetical protein